MHVFEKQPVSIEPVERQSSAPSERRLLPRAAEKSGLGRPFWLGVRATGALSLLAVGAVHLQQYLKLYYAVPTIGTLFVLNFIGATAIGLGLLAPVERLFGRWGSRVLALLVLGGIGLAATTYAFLLVSERTPLFGFMEGGFYPAAIMTAKVSELVTVGLLGSFLVARFVRRTAVARW
jgi:hypothetical protein